jgi:hypothetical protein
MRTRLARNLATAAVVIGLQLTATVMSLRRDALQRTEGAAVTGMLWVALRHRD